MVLRNTDDGETEDESASAPRAATGALAPGDRLGRHYRVQAGPLSAGRTGEAELYRCHDERSDEVVAVKLYRAGLAPKPGVLAHLLALRHADIVRLHASGEWRGRFFEAQEYCAGGALADYAPYSENDLRDLLPQILAGLNYCHQQGIVHRDVKPNNLLFRDRDSGDVVLSDFGISSVLDDSEHDDGARITETPQRRTSAYAAPELYTDAGLSAKTDYYALGITLIHLLTGASPFVGKSEQAIAWAHAQNKIPYPEQASAAFHRLLRGLTQLEAHNRWGYRQVRAWLDGEAIHDDQGRLWRDAPAVGAALPYPGYPQACTPRELAAALDQFNAENQLFRGDIRNWVFNNYFGAEMAEQIEDIRENYTNRRALGVFKLRFVLDPNYPLMVGEHRLDSIAALARLLVSADEAVLQELGTLLRQGYLACWVEAAKPVGERSAELVATMRAISERLAGQERGLALFALLQSLDPGRPLALTPQITIGAPDELDGWLRAAAPERIEAIAAAVTGPYFQEWLRASAFVGWQDDIAHIQACRRRGETDAYEAIANIDANVARRLAHYELLSRFCPSLGLPTRHASVDSPAQLAKAIDGNAQARALGVELLRGGWIATFLANQGCADTEVLERLLSEPNLEMEAKLEEALAVLNPNITRPALACDVQRLDFGWVGDRARPTRWLRLTNSTRGYIYGAVRLEHDNRGFAVEPIRIRNTPATIEVTVDPRGLPAGSRQSTTLVITTNGGEIRVPTHYRVAPWGSARARPYRGAPRRTTKRRLRDNPVLVPDTLVPWLVFCTALVLLASNWMGTVNAINNAIAGFLTANPDLKTAFELIFSHSAPWKANPEGVIEHIATPIIGLLHVIFIMISGIIISVIMYTTPVWISYVAMLAINLIVQLMVRSH